VLELRPLPIDHPDALVMITELQRFYAVRYGDGDSTPMEAAQFAAPAGYFVVGYADGEPAACGGWRAREGGEPGLRDGDAEIKRMYVRAAHRGRGYARRLLADLEQAARAAGRRRVVLETGTRQPEAIALYVSAGYAPVEKFGTYRHEPGSRCYGKQVGAADGRRPVRALSAPGR
jgi:GNAT superfamily N-acetyltransferase